MGVPSDTNGMKSAYTWDEISLHMAHMWVVLDTNRGGIRYKIGVTIRYKPVALDTNRVGIKYKWSGMLLKWV